MRLPCGCAVGRGPCSIGAYLARITGQDKTAGLPWFNFFIRRDIEEGGGCQVAKGCIYPWVLQDRTMISVSFSSSSQSSVIEYYRNLRCIARLIAPISSVQDMTQPLLRYIRRRALYLVFLGVCNGPNKYRVFVFYRSRGNINDYSRAAFPVHDAGSMVIQEPVHKLLEAAVIAATPFLWQFDRPLLDDGNDPQYNI